MASGKAYRSQLEWVVRIGAILIICLGTAVLFGWILDIPLLKSLLPGFATMKVNTACGFIASGIALRMLHSSAPGSRSFRVARVLAVIVAALGALTLAEHLFAFNFGIDELILSDDAQTVATWHPGRMSPATALNFFVTGLALFAFKARRSGLAACAHWLVVPPLFISTLAIVGYAYSVGSLYQVGTFNAMALDAACAFFVLNLCLLAGDSRHGFARIATSDTAGGLVTRRLLPTMPFILFFIGWARLAGEQAGLYTFQFGLALMVLTSTAVCVVAVAWTAYTLHEIDLVRQRGAANIINLNTNLEARVKQRTQELEQVSAELSATNKALFAEKERAQVTLNSIGDAVVCTDISGNLTFFNAVAEDLAGWSWREAAGHPMVDVVRILDGASREPIPDPMALAIELNRSANLPENCILLRRDGSEIPIEDSVAPIHDRDGTPIGAVMVFRDVSLTRAMALEIAHAAKHDFLTGLPNRLLLSDRIRLAIASASRDKSKIAVLFMDLDGFKFINDSLGHPVGDKLLQSVAARLTDCVRDSDTVSRQGGDEFVVLLADVQQLDHVDVTAKRMLQAVAEAHSIDRRDLHVTASIGASIYPDDGLSAETLIRSADTAMYQAKKNGRQSIRFFKPAMSVMAIERHVLEESLRRALERQEFSLHYQPKIHLKTGAITGAEALIRWTHPTRGLISPARFIPIAEEIGLILPIGAWVMREACAQARAWMDAGLPATSMAVNVSAIEFRNAGFMEGLFATLSETGLDPNCLELELTESVLMAQAESATFLLQTLRQRGVHVAIDDFGTGYSSLSYLHQFPVDALKIDQSFIRQIGTDSDNMAIVTAVIGMARDLNLRVIAEGVETPEEVAFLQAHQCDEAQGYYFSPPVPPEQFAKLLGSVFHRKIA